MRYLLLLLLPSSCLARTILPRSSAQSDLPDPSLIYLNGTIKTGFGYYSPDEYPEPERCTPSTITTSFSADRSTFSVSYSALTSIWDADPARNKNSTKPRGADIELFPGNSWYFEPENMVFSFCAVHYPISAPEGWEFKITSVKVRGRIGNLLEVPESELAKLHATFYSETSALNGASPLYYFPINLPPPGTWAAFEHFFPPSTFEKRAARSGCGFREFERWYSQQTGDWLEHGFTEGITLEMSAGGGTVEGRGEVSVVVEGIEYGLEWRRCVYDFCERYHCPEES